MTEALVIRLLTVDLVAQTTADLVRRLPPAAGLAFTLERRLVWLLEWSAGAPAVRIEAARRVLARPGRLYNPNKEAMRAVLDPALPLVTPAAGDAVVAAWPRDVSGVSVIRGILPAGESVGPAALQHAERVVLWWMRAVPDASGRARPVLSLAEEVAVVSDRTHGLLVNPHLDHGVVLSGEPTITELAACIQSSVCGEARA